MRSIYSHSLIYSETIEYFAGIFFKGFGMSKRFTEKDSVIKRAQHKTDYSVIAP